MACSQKKILHFAPYFLNGDLSVAAEKLRTPKMTVVLTRESSSVAPLALTSITLTNNTPHTPKAPLPGARIYTKTDGLEQR